MKGCFSFVEFFEAFFVKFVHFAIKGSCGARVQCWHCGDWSLPDRGWDGCDYQSGGCDRDDILWVNVPVWLEGDEGESAGDVHCGAHFLGSIVEIQLPLWVANSVV